MDKSFVISKYLVTGVTGAGKTSISRELKKIGINSFDFASIPDLCYWRHKTTHKIEEYSPGRSKEWLDSHERICDIQKLQDLLNCQKSTVVVTGVASGNIDDIITLFDKVFLLQCSPEKIIYRLQRRDTSFSGFGKTVDEQNSALEWQKNFNPHMLKLGTIPISSDGSIADTMEQLINQLE